MNKKKSGSYDSPLKATIKGISDLFKKQKKDVRLSDSDRLDGITIMVTGSSSGLGYATAMDLAKRGARVIMAVRSGIPERGEEIRQKSGSNKVEMMHIDLSDIESIKGLIRNLKEQKIKLNMLICNAAIVPRVSRKTKQGLEEMFMVNYLAKFLLIRWLLDKDIFITDGESLPRIIIVSSESHRNPKVYDWDNFGKYKEYGMNKTVELYGYYKLLLTTFVNELSRRLNQSSTKFSVFSLCPGPVNSNIAREAPKFFHPLLKVVFGIFFNSPEKAAVPVVYLAANNDLEGKSLDYFFMMERKEMDEKTGDPENGKKLWELSENLLKDLGISFRKSI
jgi:NAD(P)-dependent dehydrogenase (short-subunit alcohol dehydrogenase family)